MNTWWRFAPNLSVVSLHILVFGKFPSHLLFAWESVVVTRHIGHDSLLIGPQRAKDICTREERQEQRERGESVRQKGVKGCKKQQDQQRERSQVRQHWAQGTPSLLQPNNLCAFWCNIAALYLIAEKLP